MYSIKNKILKNVFFWKFIFFEKNYEKYKF